MVISSRRKAFPILALYLLLFDNRIGPNRDLGREAYATESRKSIQWSMEEGTVLYVRLFLQPLLQACWQKKRSSTKQKKMRKALESITLFSTWINHWKWDLPRCWRKSEAKNKRKQKKDKTKTNMQWIILPLSVSDDVAVSSADFEATASVAPWAAIPKDEMSISVNMCWYHWEGSPANSRVVTEEINSCLYSKYPVKYKLGTKVSHLNGINAV